MDSAVRIADSGLRHGPDVVRHHPLALLPGLWGPVRPGLCRDAAGDRLKPGSKLVRAPTRPGTLVDRIGRGHRGTPGRSSDDGACPRLWLGCLLSGRGLACVGRALSHGLVFHQESTGGTRVNPDGNGGNLRAHAGAVCSGEAKSTQATALRQAMQTRSAWVLLYAGFA
jgi:hypothetical protein